MPWLREAGRRVNRQRLALLRPSTIHQEADMSQEQWFEALAEWQAMTEKQRVEIVRAAFSNEEQEPF